VGDLVDLEHWRRAHRLCPILVDRFGAAFFVEGQGNVVVVDEARLARCADLAAEWIGRRSGRAVDDEFHARLGRMLRELVVERVLEGSARVR
jgi:hypothetical protein